MSKNFKINFNRLVGWLVPPFMRKLFFVRFLVALTSAIKVIYQEFMTFREDTNYWLGITSQVCALEKALNDTFDNEQRRITITDASNDEVLLIHKDEAQNPLITYIANQGYDAKIPVIHKAETYNDVYDFIVNIPFELSVNDEYRMRTILNKYKLVSKRYKLNYT